MLEIPFGTYEYQYGDKQCCPLEGAWSVGDLFGIDSIPSLENARKCLKGETNVLDCNQNPKGNEKSYTTGYDKKCAE